MAKKPLVPQEDLEKAIYQRFLRAPAGEVLGFTEIFHEPPVTELPECIWSEHLFGKVLHDMVNRGVLKIEGNDENFNVRYTLVS